MPDGDDFVSIWQRATRQSLRGGLGTLALLLSIACPVLILYCFNRDAPYYTAHHADAEVVNVWDPWRQPEPWHEDGRLRCTCLEETWDGLNSTVTTQTNRTCPALNSTGFTEGSLAGLRTTALFVYPVAAAARPVVLGCAFAGVLKESRLYHLQAAVGMCSALTLAVLFDLAPPVLKGGDDADGWVVVCALPSVVWLAVCVEFMFCSAQLTLARHFICQLVIRFCCGVVLLLLVFIVPIIVGVTSLAQGVSYGWLYLVCIPSQGLTLYYTRTDGDGRVRSLKAAVRIIVLEFAFCTIVYYAFYDSHFRSFVMDTTWTTMPPGMRVFFPVTVPLALLASLWAPSSRQRSPVDYNALRLDRRSEHWPPAYDLPVEASDYDSCPEWTDDEASLCDTADGVLLHLRLPNGVLVPVELGSDATLGVLRLRAVDAVGAGRMEVRVRLALCGETVAGCNATPLRDVAGLEAGATVDVDTKPRPSYRSPHGLMDLACQEDDVQAARRVLATCSTHELEGVLWAWAGHSNCRGVLHCALLEGNLASAALLICRLWNQQELASRVIQESGVLDRPCVHDAIAEVLLFTYCDYVDFATSCPGFLESTACDHTYLVMQVLGRRTDDEFDGSCFHGDYTPFWRQLHNAGWRATPSAVQEAGGPQPSFFEVNLLTLMLLADGVSLCDLPHVVRALCRLLLPLLLPAGAAIAVHAIYGTQGVDPVGGWLFVAFLCVASVTVAVELLPEWVRWLVELKVRGPHTPQPPAPAGPPAEELADIEMPLMNQSSFQHPPAPPAPPGRLPAPLTQCEQPSSDSEADDVPPEEVFGSLF